MAVAAVGREKMLMKWAKARKLKLDTVPETETRLMCEEYEKLLTEKENGEILAHTFREEWLHEWQNGKRRQNGYPCLIYTVGSRKKALALGFTKQQFEDWEHFVMGAAFANGSTGCSVEWAADGETMLIEASFQPRHDYPSGEFSDGKVKVPGDVSDLRIELQPKNIVATWSLRWQYEMKIMETRRKKLDDLTHLAKSIY